MNLPVVPPCLIRALLLRLSRLTVNYDKWVKFNFSQAPQKMVLTSLLLGLVSFFSSLGSYCLLGVVVLRCSMCDKSELEVENGLCRCEGMIESLLIMMQDVALFVIVANSARPITGMLLTKIIVVKEIYVGEGKHKVNFM